MGAHKYSRNDSGCFALKDQADPSSLCEIRLEEFLAMLRFEQLYKLAELGYLDLLGKSGAQVGLIWAGK